MRYVETYPSRLEYVGTNLCVGGEHGALAVTVRPQTTWSELGSAITAEAARLRITIPAALIARTVRYELDSPWRQFGGLEPDDYDCEPTELENLLFFEFDPEVVESGDWECSPRARG